MTRVISLTQARPNLPRPNLPRANLLRHAALAVGAMSLIAAAAPNASAAPQNDRVVNKPKVTKVADNRGDRTHRTSTHRREFRRDGRADRRDDRRAPRVDRRSDRRDVRRDAGRYERHGYSRPSRHGHRGYRTPYRSSLGISFHLGTPGYSQYRWAPTAYSFYRPVYGRYARYRNLTTCRRVILDGWYYGRRRPVSVKQCTNPWDGTYIIQGTERLVRHGRW